MKKVLAILTILTMMMATIAEARSYSSFGGSRSSFSRSYSYAPSRSYSTPKRSYYSAPSIKKPVTKVSPKVTKPVVVNKTTVIRQNNVAASVNSQPSFWSMFLPSFLGAGIGSYAGSSLAQPKAQSTEYCPIPIPQGYNKPCVPQPEVK